MHEIANVFRYAYTNLSEVVVVEQGNASAEAVTGQGQNAEAVGGNGVEAVAIEKLLDVDANIHIEQVGGP